MLQKSVKNNLLFVHFPYLPLLCGREHHGCSVRKTKRDVTPIFVRNMFLAFCFTDGNNPSWQLDIF